MPRRTRLESDLLKEIVRHYLKSHDFNGISLDRLLENQEAGAVEAVRSLVRNQLVEAISGHWDNPYIKRLPPRQVANQLEILTPELGQVVCLYPTEKYMRRIVGPTLYRNRPFTRLLALAHPQIEPVFFELAFCKDIGLIRDIFLTSTVSMEVFRSLKNTIGRAECLLPMRLSFRASGSDQVREHKESRLYS
jgi:hypothetical protein